MNNNAMSYSETIIQKVEETTEEFIFSTIKNYTEKIAPDIIVSKKELIDAIKVVRKFRELKEVTNKSNIALTEIFEVNADALENMYNKGRKDGVEYCTEKIRKITEGVIKWKEKSKMANNKLIPCIEINDVLLIKEKENKNEQ